MTDLRHYPFKIVELSSTVDEERVAEVFVRINSEGVTLNQADFGRYSAIVAQSPQDVLASVSPPKAT